MEEDDVNVPEVDNNEPDDIPPAVSIFSLFRDRVADANEDSSDSNSSAEKDASSDDEFSHLDEAMRTLPCDHEYLGELEPIRGREIMDDGSVQKIPLFPPTSPVVLVPGQTFPLVEKEESAVNILKYAVEGNHIFGILPSSSWNARRLCNAVGTTAEIIAYSETAEEFKIKAIGRQRFKVLRTLSELINERYVTFAYIRILPEISMKPVLDGIQLPSMNKLRSSHRLKCLRRDASQTRWPVWIYRYYDERYLVEAVKKKLSQNFRMSKNIRYSDDPSTLFFQLLKNIPISHKLIPVAMELNTSIQRLHWLMEVLEPKTDKLKCTTCQTTIGNSSDIFAMSAEGPHGTYVNSHGYVHELITLKKVKNVNKPMVDPEKDYTWFPGYGWSVIYCNRCQYHIGWKFTSVKENLIPSEFWAIKNDMISIKTDEKREIGSLGIPRGLRRPLLERSPRRRPRLSFH